MPRRLAITASIASSVLLLALAACKPQSAPDRTDGKAVADAAARAATVPCALNGAKAFGGSCSVERMITGDGLVLVVHHPDGGFRRLLVATDGRGVVTADGADQAVVSVIDPSTIEVRVGSDRYRLPATIKGGDVSAR